MDCPSPAAAVARATGHLVVSMICLLVVAGTLLCALNPPSTAEPLKSINLQAAHPLSGLRLRHWLAGSAKRLQLSGGLRWGSRSRVEAQVQQDIREQAAQIATRDGLVLWTLANYSWLDFVLNWVASVRRAGITSFFVACLDDELFGELQRQGVPSLALHSQLGGKELAWGSNSFKDRGRVKIKVIQTMLSVGLQPLFSDLDVVWLRDPFPYVRNFPEANLLISIDQLGPTAFGGELEKCPKALGGSMMGMMNVGVHLMRPGAMSLTQAWLDAMIQGHDMEQQHFNAVLMQDLHAANDTLSLATNQSYCWAIEGRVRVGLLPVPHFQHGYAYFTQRMDEWSKVQPYAVHTNFISGRQTKRHHFRERLLWHVDPPQRFQPPGGFLSFDLDVPEEMLAAAGPPTRRRYITLQLTGLGGHIKLITHQLSQVRVAMEVAVALGRELIMPPLWCGVDNAADAHNGRPLGVHHFKLPFQCPMAHIFDVELWLKQLDADVTMLPKFHESSFLQNEHMPEAVRKSTLSVSLCSTQHEEPEGRLIAGPRPGQDINTSDGVAVAIKQRNLRNTRHRRTSSAAGNATGKEARRHIPGKCNLGGDGGIGLDKSMNDMELRNALHGTANTSILHFPDIRSVWRGHASHNAALAFQAAARNLTRPWCCLTGKKAIVFDMLWDVVPHTDRWGVVWNAPWIPFPVPKTDPELKIV